MLPPVALFPEGPDQTGRQASVPDYSSGLKSPLFGFNISRRSRIPEIAGSAVDALARAIAEAISGVLTSVRLSGQDFFEDDTKLYRVSQDFSVWGA